MRIASVKFLNKFLDLDVGGRFPGIVYIIIVVPLDKVVDLPLYLLGIKNAFYLVNFFAVNHFRLGNGVFKDRTIMG